jgi:hypothetical protein
MAPDLLSTIRAEIAERMDGLLPLLAERERLLVAAEALEAARANAAQADVATHGVTAPRSRRTKRAEAQPEVSQAATGVVHDGVSAASEPASEAKRPRTSAKPGGKAVRAARGAAREAILAALEHGSHTVGELSVVTAMSVANINGNLRRLVAEGLVVKTAREGKTAWSLVEGVV